MKQEANQAVRAESMQFLTLGAVQLIGYRPVGRALQHAQWFRRIIFTELAPRLTSRLATSFVVTIASAQPELYATRSIFAKLSVSRDAMILLIAAGYCIIPNPIVGSCPARCTELFVETTPRRLLRGLCRDAEPVVQKHPKIGHR
jgi:hypothetical protein